MPSSLSKVLVAAVTLAGAWSVSAAPAHAASLIPLGGGSPIWIQVNQPTPTAITAETCTVTAVGHDRAGNLVALTNAHCFIDKAGNKLVGDKVYKSTAPGGQGLNVAPTPTAEQAISDVAVGPIGTATYVSEPNNLLSGGPAGLDYAVIELDPAKVAPVSTVGGVTITSIGDLPPIGTRMCKQGWATGLTCGVLTGSDSKWFTSLIWTWAGDSGSPTVVGNTLVGNAWGAFHHTRILSILADMDAHGGVGAGFHLG
ncbi:peptidase S1 [Kitasatospora sp. NPDC056138]|uniref:peptidase S1 n=1 Tax=Kitasatospora sp. NPDC056138 TaxID=3345724 RepID=UPI0035E023B7